jgi:hypothetical protein
MKRNDGDEDTCKDAKKLAVQICPEDWVSKLITFFYISCQKYQFSEAW